MNYGLYFHWPFCLQKCPYCDFNSYASSAENLQDWDKEYKKELQKFLDTKPKSIDTIFFGGGTPSLMPISTLADLIEMVNKNGYNPKEITIETNPKTLSDNLFKNFKEIGINRVSIGVQSFNPESLKFLGRIHGVEESIQTIESVKKHFNNWSIDLIYALKKQNMQDWEKQIETALTFNPPHISLYQLTIEEGTLFAKNNVKGASEKISEQLYKYTIQRLEAENLPYYEVSNFSKPINQSEHNKIYWEGKAYYGIGPGASGRIHNSNEQFNGWMEQESIKNPKKWLEAEDKFTIKEIKPLERLEEFVLMGLRLREGIDISVYQKLNQDKVNTLIDEHLIKIENNKLKHTKKGLLKLNGIINYLLS